MEALVYHLIRMLVDHPDEVQVHPQQSGVSVIYRVSVAGTDLGQIIGRRGRTADALRAVVGAAARHRQERATIDIVS